MIQLMSQPATEANRNIARQVDRETVGQLSYLTGRRTRLKSGFRQERGWEAGILNLNNLDSRADSPTEKRQVDRLTEVDKCSEIQASYQNMWRAEKKVDVSEVTGRRRGWISVAGEMNSCLFTT